MEDPSKRKRVMAEIRTNIEELFAEVDWEQFLDRDIQRVADSVVDPDHRENVLALVRRYRSQIERGTESPAAILGFLEEAAEEGLIPLEWIDPETTTQSYVRIGDPERWQESFREVGRTLRPLPSTWDEATTIVMRAEQMQLVRTNQGRVVAQRLNQFLRQPIGTSAHWLVLGQPVLDTRMDQIEKADVDQAVSAKTPDIEALWALIRKRGGLDAHDGPEPGVVEPPLAPASTFKPTGQHMIAIGLHADRQGALIDEWLADMVNTTAMEITEHPEFEEIYVQVLEMVEDIWERHVDAVGDSVAIEEWREKYYVNFKTFFALAVAGAPFDVRQTIDEIGEDVDAVAVLRKLNPDIIHDKRFSDFRNPYYPLLMTWMTGTPLVSSSERGQTFVLPSAGIVDAIRGKKKYDA